MSSPQASALTTSSEDVPPARAGGRLDQSLHAASERTGEAYGKLVEDGLDPPSAWEAVREEWAFLPAESDQPSPPSLSPLPASTEPMQELFPRSPNQPSATLMEDP